MRAIYISLSSHSDEDIRHTEHRPGARRHDQVRWPGFWDLVVGSLLYVSWDWVSLSPILMARTSQAVGLPWGPGCGVTRVTKLGEKMQWGWIYNFDPNWPRLSWEARAGLDLDILLWSLYQTIRLNRIINCSFQNVTILRNHFPNLFSLSNQANELNSWFGGWMDGDPENH